MSGERTLGEILGEALTRPSPAGQVAEQDGGFPAAIVSWMIAPAVEAAARQRLAADAQYRCALALSDALAPVLRCTSAQVFDALSYVPDNMLSLLCSPEGWSALAQFVAADLGAPCLNYKPTIQ